MSSIATSLLWEEFFRDPSGFWDNRHAKLSPNSPDFRHKQTRKLLWIHGSYNPPWVLLQLKQMKSFSPCRGNSGYEVKNLSASELGHRINLVNELKACRKENNISKIKEIHTRILEENLVATDVRIGTALLRAYAACGAVEKAQEVFDQLHVHDVVSWTALLGGYAQHGLGHETLECFKQMQDEGISPDSLTYTCVLKACGLVGSLKIGEEVYGKIKKLNLLKKDVILGNSLVDMFAKCGKLQNAREVFEQLPLHDVVSWNALIGGYIHHGLGDETLKCFSQMQDEGTSANVVTYICVLKACGISGSKEMGEYIDTEVRKKNLFPKDLALGNALVAMYMKCGAHEKARAVFDELPRKDVVTWTSLIAGYAHQGLSKEALKCFKHMKDAGISPDAVTYACLLKVCGIIGSLEIGEDIASEVIKRGLLKKDAVLGNALVNMYAKCGELGKAQYIFEQLPVHDVFSWTTLIDGYTQHGLSHETLKCFRRMKNEGVCPDATTYACVLKACSATESLEVGEQIDADVRSLGLLHKDVLLGNALINMFAKCGVIDRARDVFDRLLIRNVESWNALISGYVRHGFGDEALKCFRRMQDERVCPNMMTYTCVLKACGITGSIEMGEDIRVRIKNLGLLLQNDGVLGNALIDMYTKCGMLEKAQEVFEQLVVRDVVAWTTLIAGYAQNGLSCETLQCFSHMKVEGVLPDATTYTCVFKACGISRSLEVVEDIVAEVYEQGLLEEDLLLGNTLVDMYAKHGALVKAQEVFAKLPRRDIVSWTVLIAGYAQSGLGKETLNCFRQMQDDGICPDAVTYAFVLKACGIVRSLETGEEIHAEIRKNGLLVKDHVLGCALLDMYGKCGMFEKAWKIFEQLLVRDVLSWNALIGVYSQHGLSDEAFICLKRMQNEGVYPDVVTYTCILKACSMVGSPEIGENIHIQLIQHGLLKEDVVLGNTLLDMYVKCGVLEKAQEVFQELSVRDVVSWTTLIAGYAQLGLAKMAFYLSWKMRTEGITPNAITFLVLLTSCGHAGLLNEGEKLFDEMLSSFGSNPTIEHYTCMIDIFGRAGRFEKANAFLEKVSPSQHLPILLAILGASHKWGDVKVGRWAFEESIRLNDECATPYVWMENIYAVAGD